MAEQRLTTFGEIVQVVAEMPVILRNARRARGVSVREAGSAIGVSASTVSRMENGEEFTSVSFVAVLTWLDGNHA